MAPIRKSKDAVASPDVLEQESLAWVNQLLSGAVTGEDAEALKLWRARSTQHEQAFADAVRFQRAVARAIRAERAAPANVARAPAPLPSRGASQVARRAFLGSGLAAAAGYVFVRPPDHLWPSLAEWLSDYRTGVGERRDVNPAPGVAVSLNTQTAITMKRSGRPPALDLISGEVSILASRSPQSPFTVLAGPGTMVMDRARINLRHTGDQVCLTCLDGVVEVRHPHGGRRLSGGSALTYTSDGLGNPAAVDGEMVTAWRRGLLIFRDAPLEHVVDELNRYRPGRVLLMDRALRRHPVFAVFQVRHLDGAISEIGDLTGATVTHLPGGVVIIS